MGKEKVHINIADAESELENNAKIIEEKERMLGVEEQRPKRKEKSIADAESELEKNAKIIEEKERMLGMEEQRLKSQEKSMADAKSELEKNVKIVKERERMLRMEEQRLRTERNVQMSEIEEHRLEKKDKFIADMESMLEKKEKLIEENEMLREQRDKLKKDLDLETAATSSKPVSSGDHMKVMLTISFVIWYMQGQFYNVHIQQHPSHFEKIFLIIIGSCMDAATMACMTYAAVRKSDHFFFNTFLVFVNGIVMTLLGVVCNYVMCGISAFSTGAALVILFLWQSPKSRKVLIGLRADAEKKCNNWIDKLVCCGAAKAAKEEKRKQEEEDRKKKQEEEDRERNEAC